MSLNPLNNKTFILYSKANHCANCNVLFLLSDVQLHRNEWSKI